MLCLMSLLSIIACGRPSEDKIRSLMETHLQEKYGEPFVVENIGTRDANGQKFYTARIYPKSIVGTSKEMDDYYYATVNIDILHNGKLRKTGDTYGEVNTKEEAEKYLLPKVKELFGERIRLKTEPELQEKDNSNGLWYGYITSHFQDARDKAKNNPKKYRLKINLYLNIFDKIDNEKEKKVREKQIFEFIQYLKGEGLFEYCILYTVFLDDYVVTNTFKEKGISINDNTEYAIGDSSVYLSPTEERKSIYKECEKEYEKMKDEEIINRINHILKSELSYDYYAQYGAQMYSEVYSKKLAQEEYKAAVENGEIELLDYSDANDIIINLEKNYLFNFNLKEKRK